MGKTKFLRFLLLWLFSFALLGCTEKKIVIGVSQCSDDEWRRKVNQEIRMGQYKYKNVDVVITSADNDAYKQVRQIDSLVRMKVDLLVIAPSVIKTVTPAIERAYRSGVPIILYDRKINSPCYTAYIGADNVEIGRGIAKYLAEKLNGKGQVLEIAGEKGSSPVIERHQGFMDEMRKHPFIKITTLYGDWEEKGARNLMRKYLDDGKTADAVFGHNDAEAAGAMLAAREKGLDRRILFVGIDGLPGKYQGIDRVKQGEFAASYIYPTRGEYIVPLAMDILHGKPYKRKNYFHTCLVTIQNADLMEMQYRELEVQAKNLDAIYSSINDYMKMYRSQKMVSILSFVIVLLLILLVFYIVYVYRTKEKMAQHRKQLAEEQIRFFTNASHQLRTPLTLVAGPVTQLLEKGNFDENQLRLLQIVSRNVRQLESLTSDVLNFKSQVDSMAAASKADDKDVDEMVSQNVLKDSRRQILVHRQEEEELATILVVDDNADIRSYLHSILSEQYYVVEASDGKNGLRLAKESVPDIIISDVMMPVMDGLTFCSKIKENEVTCHIPVILLTARSDESQRIEGYEHGADAYLTKPFKAEVLKARVVNLLNLRHRIERQNVGLKSEMNDLDKMDRSFLDRFKRKITERMGDADLRMDDLGAELGLSKVQMYRKIKALTGKTPAELLREIRLHRACSLLKQTDKTVAEVAAEVGFAIPGYFSSCFKKQFGCNPTDIRTES